MFVTNLLNLPTTVFMKLMDLSCVSYLLKHTAFHTHYKSWRNVYKNRIHIPNLILDRLCGIIFACLLLLWFRETRGSKIIEIPHILICKLRELLQALQGNPIGLKLNAFLNTFLFDCFNYHIDLWHKFLDLLTPLIKHLCIAYSCIGLMGLSYQLALLADIISVVTLHAHCFYVYSDVLYRVMIEGLQVLWRMMLGKRRNILKDRVEKYSYMDRQLYLATIFFAMIVFLLPTILVYYAVFASLRFGLFSINCILKFLCEKLISYPIQNIFKRTKIEPLKDFE